MHSIITDGILPVKALIKKLYDRLRHGVQAVAPVVLSCIVLASCSSDDIPDTGNGNGEVWLAVDIRNLSSDSDRNLTRADSSPFDPEGHPDEEAEAAENYIDVSDLCLMLFNSENRLVRVCDSGEYDISEQTSGSYRLLMKASPDYLGATAADTGKLQFTVMIVANLHGTGSGDGAYSYSDLLHSVKTLSGLHRGFGYTGLSGSSAWSPSVSDGRLIPMAGTVTATITKADLEGSTTPENAVTLPTLYMQRAMAQIRLVDAVADDNFKITGVKVRGFNSRGAYIPELEESSAWSYNTQVLEYATSQPGWYRPGESIPSQPVTIVNTRGEWSGMEANARYNAYRFYVPEFSWSAAGEEEGPLLDITVYDKTSAKSRNFIYRFPDAVNGRRADLVRNHIYQVVVTDIKAQSQLSLKINYGICPWQTETVDIPSFNRPPVQ